MFLPRFRFRRNPLPGLIIFLLYFALTGILSGQILADSEISDLSADISSNLPICQLNEKVSEGLHLAQAPSPSVATEKADPKPDTDSPSKKVEQLNAEVVKLYRQGNYEKAFPLAVEARDLTGRTLGEDRPEYADSLDNLASLYKAAGEFGKAEPLLMQALTIRRKALGEDDPDVIISMNNLAGLYVSTGKYTDAREIYLRSLEKIRAIAGEDNIFFVKCLNNLASLYKAMGDYVAVEPLYIKARDIQMKISGEDKPDYAIIISNLAHLYALTGRYSEAEPLYLHSLEITRKLLGEQHPQYSRTLNNLASLYEWMGSYGKAEPLYQQALATMTAGSGKNSPDAATALNNLAGLYKAIGDFDRAESFFRQANDIRRTVYGENHPDFALGLNNMADLYYSTGRFEEARQLYEKALQIEQAGLGEKHPDTALYMQNLAVLLKTTGKYTEAEPLFLKTLDIWKSALGEQSLEYALTLNNLAALYFGMGKYTEAEPLYRQALDIRIALLGEDHPDVGASLNSVAGLCAATSRENEALELMKLAQGINDRLIRNVFTMASEGQRLRYLSFLRGETDAYLSLISQYMPKSPDAARAGLDLVLKRKAIVAEAMAAERDAILGGRYPELEPKLRELKTLRFQIAQKMMSGPGPEGIDAHRNTLTTWEEEKGKIEVYLAGKIPEFNLEKRLMDADRQAVAKALPGDAALVEFVRFDLFDFKAIRAQGQPVWKPAHYLVFVMLSGDPDRISMIDLGQADAIDRMISDFRTKITGESDKRGGRGIVTRTEQKDAGDTGGGLRAALFDPIMEGLHGSKRVFLAPDSNLYRLAFGALPTGSSRCLIDDYHISYVGSGRDILRFGSISQPGSAAPMVTADPDYDLNGIAQPLSTAETAPEGKLSRALLRNSPRFERLPGTRTEGEHIADMLGVKPLVDTSASKGQLKAIHSPRILHIATHGFFLPDQEPASNPKNPQGDTQGDTAIDRNAGQVSRSVENPLLRSGLVLAGANAWLQGRKLPVEDEDGILTGEDASGLDLLSTELVVLSACETGLGDIRVGEGVFGLRRAFLLAGAKTLVMSLWKVPDAQTQMLMEAFYKRILDGRPREEALREAQLAVKESHPEPFYWAAFICQGDPGPLPAVGQKK
jgi:CHAT domain-containing protein/tetratricopeptide (TPR) repeat protein